MRNYRYKILFLLVFLMAGAFSIGIKAQVVKAFEQRASNYTPDRLIYNIRGDFQMIGNTNLTLQSYDPEGNNSGQMIYVDKDYEVNTLNSSSAFLTFPQENDSVNHNCTNIIYAGLYWTGRAHDGTSSPNTFSVTKQVPGSYTPVVVDEDYTVSHNNGINNSNYTMTVSRQGSYNSYYVRYTFTSSVAGQPTVLFDFLNSTPYIRYSTDNGNTWTNPTNQTTTNNVNLRTTTFDPVTVYSESGGITLTVNQLVRDSRTNQSASTYQTTARASGHISGTYMVPGPPQSVTVNFDKRKIKLKHANDNNYATFTATAEDILYPTNTNGLMYAGYVEVTDYVKEHGIGEYFVADIALREGEGGGTGYYGGWGLIVVYENSNMKWRDVTIFDGYAYVQGSTTISHTLPISGFRTAQSGQIEMKLGIIAGEGDRSISGDYFEIQRLNNANDWVRLSHSGNSTNNFFNGSIPGANPNDKPKLKNNTGLDIAMFNIDNGDGTPGNTNTIIANNQTSTTFRYGSTQDTYIIPCIAMAVDAYVPELVPFVSAEVNGAPASSTTVVHPGEEIEYTLAISNPGNEAINNTIMNIPIPFNATLVNGSLSGTIAPGSGVAPSTPIFDTATNSIKWEIGTIPYQNGSHDPVAVLKFKIKVTTNCYILSVDECSSSVDVVGTSSGVGATSGTEFLLHTFVTGYQTGDCADEPIYGSLKIHLNATDYVNENCEPIDPAVGRIFYVCFEDGINPTTYFNSNIKTSFPPGTRFWSSYTIDDEGYVIPSDGAIEYTATNPFPINELGDKHYHAIPPGRTACVFTFTIRVERCKNYWVGSNAADGTAWNTPANWSRNSVLEPNEDLEFATVANNNGNAAINHLYVPANDPKVVNNVINASDKDLVVTPASFLTVNATVTDGNADAGTIVVQADPADQQPAGTLFFTTPGVNTAVAATAQFYSWAHKCTDCGVYNQSWQYFGIPVRSATAFPVNDVVGTETINIWREDIDGNKWLPATSFEAFKGYEITNDVTSKPNQVYSFNGTLYVGNATVPLTRTPDKNYSGVNLVGNSFTAAIPISEAAFTFPANVDKTLYLFNTGTRDEWRKLNGANVTGYRSGQYLAVPVNLGGQEQYPAIIPSTHAFMVIAGEAFTSGNLTINYNQLVKNEKVNLGDGTMVVTRGSNDDNYDTALPNITIDVLGEGSADRLWIFTEEETTFGFDNGWDGYKMEEFGFAQIYAVGDDWENRFQVTTVPEIDNLLIGFQTEVEGDYTLEFALSDHFAGETIYLYDMSTGARQQVENNGFYGFYAKGGDYGTRFRLSTDDGMSDNSQIFVTADDRQITITNYTADTYIASIYTIDGKFAHQLEVKPGSVERTIVASKGVYAVRLQSASTSIVRKVVVK